MVMDFSS